ncbi:MAG: 2Fe-2S iron-sulfur cluster-binding protein [Myxococcales bacterium]|nr:2Fe-2S iron-sulfur cluster-binding protein [Polyangiaceae bacterium]MDW8248324.1 2Fe-2S iron-sulfur cluster-binding protein [Myxococcales bacterium]
MPASRTDSLRHPVTFTLDGEPLQAEQGEPLAQALVASDRLILARSPKLHRPRGPWCMRGGCDGCLMRVDGVPNVMTCLHPVTEGTRVETQNVLGTRTTDLLRVTDWFFPNGIDHHHLLAGVPGLSSLMQSFARRVAGLGTLPERPAPEARGRASSIDALVIGGGPSGIAAASTLATHGLQVVLVDDALDLGGGARALGQPILHWLFGRFPLQGVRLLQGWVAAGIYEGAVLLMGSSEAELLRPEILVLACGAHDGSFLFENNDLPGVFSARAAALLASSGVAIGRRIVSAGRGPFSHTLRAHLMGKAEFFEVEATSLLRAEGASRVGGVVLREGNRERKLRCDALVIEAPAAPAFELAEQAGGEALWREGRGFFPQCEPSGKLTQGVWVVGEARGLPFEPERLAADGRTVAEAALADR